MRRVLEKARELTDAILASEEFRAYQEAEIELLNDDEVQGLLERLQACEARLRSLGYRSGEEGQRLAEEVRHLRAAVEAHPTYARYRAARAQLDRLVGQVIDVISFGLTGEERQAAGCGSGGCGCGLPLPPAARRAAV